MKTVKDIGEDRLIQRITQNAPLKDNVLVGPGDDCAVIKHRGAQEYSLLKTDSIIEGVHFLPSADPYSVGWKSVARVVSDFAAMGGIPDSVVIALALPQQTPLETVDALYKGIYACAKLYDFSVVGGETSAHEKMVITVSGIGRTPHFITRSGALPGDSIWVTGTLGGSIEGKHLHFSPRVEEAQWLKKHLNITAMMDLSDGLAKDLPRLALSSNKGFHIERSSIPCTEGSSYENAIADGEDYELLLTATALKHPQLSEFLSAWKKQFPSLLLTHIGEITPQSQVPLKGGWEHFSNDIV